MRKLGRYCGGFWIAAGLLLLIYPLWAELNVFWEQQSLGRQHASYFNGEKDKNSKQTAIPPATFGSALLEIPAIDLSVMVAPGTSARQLKKAPGWYQNSELPGRGNTCIASHRTTYGGWFRSLDRLTEKDKIYLTWGGKIFTYYVQRVFTVDEDCTKIFRPSEEQVLTLITCSGRHKRLVVRGSLYSGRDVENYAG